MSSKNNICDLLETVIANTSECSDIIYICYDERNDCAEVMFSGEKSITIATGKSEIDMVYDIVKVCMNHAVVKGKTSL